MHYLAVPTSPCSGPAIFPISSILRDRPVTIWVMRGRWCLISAKAVDEEFPGSGSNDDCRRGTSMEWLFVAGRDEGSVEPGLGIETVSLSGSLKCEGKALLAFG